jgi:hypothetical protein
MQSSSKKAFKKNVETEMDANPGKDKRSQNLAIAYSVQRKNKKTKKMAYGGKAENDNNPGTPAAKPDNRRLNKDDYMSGDWAGGPDLVRKPDDQQRPKSAYLDTNDWSDGEKPSRKPFADGGTVTSKPNTPRPSQMSTESKDLNDRAARQGMTHEQMAEMYEQEAAKHRMYANGGIVDEDGSQAQQDGYPGTPAAKPDDDRRPKSAYIDTDQWSDDELPSRKPFAKGGMVRGDHNARLSDRDEARSTSMPSQKMPSLNPSELMTAQQRANATAEAVMKSRKKNMDDGGEVDIQANGDEEGSSPYDDMNADAVENGEYDDSQLSDQPMDSNQTGDDIESDVHDLVDTIRKKLMAKRQM